MKKAEKSKSRPKWPVSELFRQDDSGVLPLNKKSSKSLIKSESWRGQAHFFKGHFSWVLKSH